MMKCSSTTTTTLLFICSCMSMISSGTCYGDFRWTSAIIFPGTEFRTFRNVMSSAKSYIGYFAKVGDEVTINCSTTWAPDTKLTHTKYIGPSSKTWPVPDDLPIVANDEQRKTWIEGHKKITLVIHSATVADSGGYWCADDAKQLSVIDVSNLPTVTNHRCTRSMQLPGLQCWFYTNTSSYNFVTWEITLLNDSSPTNESQANSVCAEMKVSREEETGFDKLYCLIGDYRYLESYTLRIAGQNPFFVEGVTVVDLPEPMKNIKIVTTDSQTHQTVDHLFMVREAFPHDYYSGAVAKVGDVVTVGCVNESAEIIFTNINGTTEILFGTTGNSSVREVKSSVELEDSGRYECGGDFQLLTVVDPSHVPTILSHQCVSEQFDSLECTFLTNTNRHHLVDWKVSFSTRKSRFCYFGLCKDVPCDEVKVIPATGDQLYDTVKCAVYGWMFNMMTYDLSVKAASLYASTVTNISTVLDGSIVRPAQPKILAANVSDVSASLHVQLFEVWRLKKIYSAAGFMELVANSDGINFKLQVTELKAGHVKTLTSTCNCTAAWLDIPHLKPSTQYSINVSLQVARTLNKDIWSDDLPLTFTTAEPTKWKELKLQSDEDALY